MSDNASHECDMCYEDFTDEHPAVALPNCRHVYGRECIQMWINSDNEQHDKCPMCRAPILDASPPVQHGPALQIRVHPIPDQPPVQRGPTVQAGNHPIRIHHAPVPQIVRQSGHVPAETRGAPHQIRHAPEEVHRVYHHPHRNESFESYSSASSASSGSSYRFEYHYQPHHHHRHGHDHRQYHGHQCTNRAPTGLRNRIRNFFRRRTPEPRCDHHLGGHAIGDTVVRIETHWDDGRSVIRDLDMMLESLRFDHWE